MATAIVVKIDSGRTETSPTFRRNLILCAPNDKDLMADGNW